jgi:hypothetical protein
MGREFSWHPECMVFPGGLNLGTYYIYVFRQGVLPVDAEHDGFVVGLSRRQKLLSFSAGNRPATNQKRLSCEGTKKTNEVPDFFFSGLRRRMAGKPFQAPSGVNGWSERRAEHPEIKPGARKVVPSTWRRRRVVGKSFRVSCYESGCSESHSRPPEIKTGARKVVPSISRRKRADGKTCRAFGNKNQCSERRAEHLAA